MGKINLLAMVLCLFTVYGSLSAQDLKKGLLYEDFFRDGVKLQLKGGAKVVQGALNLDGRSAYGAIPNSSDYTLGPSGLSLVITAKLKDSGTAAGGKAQSLDMFFFKDKEYLFSRSGKKFYFNFYDGKGWNAIVSDGEVPLDGKWNQYILTVEHFSDKAQGDEGYKVSVYVNGELDFTKRISRVTPKSGKNPVEIGKGWGGPWFLNGQIGHAALYKRALTDGEAAALAAREKRIKVRRSGFAFVPENVQKLLTLPGNAAASTRWAAECLLRSAAQGADLQKVTACGKMLRKWMKCASFTELSAKFNAHVKGYRLLVDHKSAVLVELGRGKGSHPVLGFYDLERKHEVFGDRTLFWEIAYRTGKVKSSGKSTTVAFVTSPEKGKKFRKISSWDPNITWNSVLKDKTLTVSWDCQKPFAFRALSQIHILPGRLESQFSVRNGSADYILHEVTYPAYSFRKLPGKTDFMTYPYMSGVLIPDPVENRFKYGQEGRYPSGSVTMQFGSYYDEKSGIYFGMEDDLARSKYYAVSGRQRNLHVKWYSPVPLKNAFRGGNSFTLRGKGAVELFKGSWYEAGQIYRKFLEKKAHWWIKDLPRRSSSPWFRDCTLWILAFSGDRAKTERLLKQTIDLRNYFELPFGIHWYGWDDSKKIGWPQFPPKDFVKEFIPKFKKNSVYTIPYIDSRLWKINDGPNNTDYRYKSHGLKYAVRSLEYGVKNEDYGKNSVYTIMCPGSKGWQKELVDLTLRVANMGFSGVYHDQVGTGRPRFCFNANHGHLLHDPAVWLEQGYWPIFDQIFKVLHKTHPQFCHTTEENAEPYLKQFDGFMVWRWTDAEQIPLFQSIYSGRVQFVGRLFNHCHPGDKQSFFSKVGQQLVNSEQIGWFTIDHVAKPDDRKLFVKKAMHIRLGLLDYFNEGKMLSPLRFSVMALDRSKWGGNNPQIVTMNALASSVWEGKDGSKMYLFVNTQGKKVRAVVRDLDLKGKGLWICEEGAASLRKADFVPELNVPPYSTVIWLQGSRVRAEKIMKTLKKVASFDKGIPLSISTRQVKAIRGAAGKKYDMNTVARWYNCTLAEDGSFVSWIKDKALLETCEVDFGKGKTGNSTLFADLAVDPAFAGRTLEVYMREKDSTDQKIGSLKLGSTSSWKTFRTVKIPLSRPLSGRKQLIFRFRNGDYPCVMRNWSYR